MNLNAIAPGRVNASLTISEHNRTSIQSLLGYRIDAFDVQSTAARSALRLQMNFISLTFRRVPDVTRLSPHLPI